MAAPTSLLQGGRAFARDFPRDQMPRGYLWDVVDYVPTFIDASLTGRGGWRWGSDGLGTVAQTGILASYTAGDQLLFQTAGGRLMQVNPDPPYNVIADRGAVYSAIQNPVQRLEDVVHFDGAGAAAPMLIRSGSIVTAPSPAPKATVGTVWGSYLVTGGGQGETDTVRFSHPTNDLATAGGWDAVSSQRTAAKVTGLAALRSVIIVFHAGSTERIRGSTPPNSTSASDDLNVEPLFNRTGCSEPKTIAYWNENVVFADEHGCHLTDGAVVRNLVSQGGILSFWRNLWSTRTYAAACTFLDYYIVTLGQSAGAVTLVVDLNKRQWFRFSNMPVQAYVSSGGSTGMERIWGGLSTYPRAIRLGPVFFPVPAGQNNDDDGTPVLPVFETPWYRLGEEGRKRVRFAYLSYDVRQSGGLGTKLDEGEAPPPEAPPELRAQLAPVLEVGYIRSPQMQSYTVLGQLPYTTAYSRYRIPVGQMPYGIAFRVRQASPASVNRIFDLAVEAEGVERSRG